MMVYGQRSYYFVLIWYYSVLFRTVYVFHSLHYKGDVRRAGDGIRCRVDQLDGQCQLACIAVECLEVDESRCVSAASSTPSTYRVP
jgi:hypothetical protein